MPISIYKKNFLELSKFFLSCLVLMININGNNFFHLKEIFFILFILTSYNYANYKMLGNFLLMIFIYMYSAIINLLFAPDYEITAAIHNLLGFIYLYLQIFETEIYRKTIIKSFMYSAIIVAILSSIIWFICVIFPIAGRALSLFFELHTTDAAAFIFLITRRSILGIEFYRVYYCTAPCMICALGYCFIMRMNTCCNKYILGIIIFTFALIISGARANILIVILIYGVYICTKLLKKGYIATSYFIFMCAFFVSVFLLIIMISEKTDGSIRVKGLHKLSYKILFKEHPYKTIFTGWGAGSLFYSYGYGGMASSTELSLYETIRRYGLISTILIFLFIWGRPIFYVLKKNLSIASKLLYSVIIISYVIVASTNPFLLGSIGFCSLIFMEVFIYYYKEKEKN